MPIFAADAAGACRAKGYMLFAYAMLFFAYLPLLPPDAAFDGCRYIYGALRCRFYDACHASGCHYRDTTRPTTYHCHTPQRQLAITIMILFFC